MHADLLSLMADDRISPDDRYMTSYKLIKASNISLSYSDLSSYLSSLMADDREPDRSSPDDRAPSDRSVLTPLSDRVSSSILDKAVII